MISNVHFRIVWDDDDFSHGKRSRFLGPQLDRQRALDDHQTDIGVGKMLRQAIPIAQNNMV